MNKEELIEFLKENLSIGIQIVDFGEKLLVYLKLNDEIITEEDISLDALNCSYK